MTATAPAILNTDAPRSAKAGKTSRQARMARLAAFLVVGIAIMLPEAAMASAPWDRTANQVLAIFTGGLTRTIAIIAVIGCGLAALFGKLSWDWASKIIIGIVLIFGGAALVDYLIAAAA